jgi:glycine/D-amino acid oxidase-like deaminating enzyme
MARTPDHPAPAELPEDLTQVGPGVERPEPKPRKGTPHERVTKTHSTATVKPQRSYCLAFDVPGDLTSPMFISVDSPTRSVRYAPTAGGDKLIVGGAGHPVGRSDGPSRSIDELRRWTFLHYPGAMQTHFWSAQDYHSIDELPYVGALLPGNDKICVATGFDKWGMTNGVAAALALSARILGGRMD